MEVSCPYFDPEYEIFNERLNGPRVSLDNESCERCTIVQVDSLKKQELLLEVVQVLTDMDLCITKGYISSDAGWFMDVFHVKDQMGNKVTDKNVINYIQQAIGTRRKLQLRGAKSDDNATRNESCSDCTAIEMIGTNRPGLFSEISAVLAEERCNVVEAHLWSHNTSIACVAYVSDESTSTWIDDPHRLSTIEGHLSTVLGQVDGDNDCPGVKTCLPRCDSSVSQAERRLHQLMLANRDFDGPSGPLSSFSSSDTHNCEKGRKTVVSIDQCNEKGYSVVNVECLDRPRLMFDTMCTLTDMHLVVFHANIASHGPFAHQEYFIRHEDGCILDSSDASQRLMKCLEAAIERRVCEGVRLELDAVNSLEVLPYFTRTLREYGLTITRADIAAHGENTKNIFYIKDISGKEVDMDLVESLKKDLDPLVFQVRSGELPQKLKPAENDDGFSLANFLKSPLETISRSFGSMERDGEERETF